MVRRVWIVQTRWYQMGVNPTSNSCAQVDAWKCGQPSRVQRSCPDYGYEQVKGCGRWQRKPVQASVQVKDMRADMQQVPNGERLMQ